MSETGPDPLVLPLDCAVDPSNRESLYVLTVDFATFTVSLFRSTDGARTWAPLPGLPPLDGPQLVRVSPTNPQTLYVGNVTGDSNDGIYVSHDGGASFMRLPASPQFPARLAAHPTRDGTLFVASFDGPLFRSTDGGATFAQAGPVNSKAFDNPSFVAFDASDASTVYVAAGPAGLYRSRDSGVTFAHVAPTPDQVGPSGVLVVGVAPSRNQRTHVYVSTDRGLYRSDDDAKNFTSRFGRALRTVLGGEDERARCVLELVFQNREERRRDRNEVPVPALRCVTRVGALDEPLNASVAPESSGDRPSLDGASRVRRTIAARRSPR